MDDKATFLNGISAQAFADAMFGTHASRLVSAHERVIYGSPQAGWRCAWCSDPRRHAHQFVSRETPAP